MIHDYMVGNCSCTGHIEQNQMFEVLICELVKVNLVVNLKPEKVLFYGIKRPVLFLLDNPDQADPRPPVRN